uniref:Uncharacterized protein n=1 Tax=Anopheles albimanus TaxID=7167 RepID=A0A182FZ17_ANOAL
MCVRACVTGSDVKKPIKDGCCCGAVKRRGIVASVGLAGVC